MKDAILGVCVVAAGVCGVGAVVWAIDSYLYFITAGCR